MPHIWQITENNSISLDFNFNENQINFSTPDTNKTSIYAYFPTTSSTIEMGKNSNLKIKKQNPGEFLLLLQPAVHFFTDDADILAQFFDGVYCFHQSKPCSAAGNEPSFTAAT